MAPQMSLPSPHELTSDTASVSAEEFGVRRLLSLGLLLFPVLLGSTSCSRAPDSTSKEVAPAYQPLPGFSAPDYVPGAEEIARAKSFVSVIPVGRPLPERIRAVRQRWSDRVAQLSIGMTRDEVRKLLEASEVPYWPGPNEGFQALDQWPLDSNWRLALAWSDFGRAANPRLTGWRVYGFADDLAALPRGDIELMLRTIGLCDYFFPDGHDPSELLRVVNSYIRAGEVHAMESLRALLEMPAPNRYFFRDQLSILVRALYLADSDELPPFESQIMNRDHEILRVKHPTLPIVFIDDLPFLLVDWKALFGVWLAPGKEDLEWASSHGRFRTGLLCPKQSPGKTAAQLLAELESCGVGQKYIFDVWDQAARAAGFGLGARYRIESDGTCVSVDRAKRFEEFRAVSYEWDPSTEFFRKP
ncbi:MAG: hypothetical protein FD180_4045 [Planctomycetota bacterium]|nr:MAG: hypothetical protein FD180_4045 [Planctomycetota bacterium]